MKKYKMEKIKILKIGRKLVTKGRRKGGRKEN